MNEQIITELAPRADASALVRKLGSYVLLSEEEIEFLEGMQSNLVKAPGGHTLVEDGADFPATFLVRSGWVQRCKVTPQGNRQILSFSMPGDFIGLHVNFRRTAACAAETIGAVELALIEPARILEIYQRFPILATGLSWSTVREFNILGEHAVSLGRRTARGRIAHLLLELWCRLKLVDRSPDVEPTIPLTQQHLADCMGLSTVHTNRILRQMEREGLIRYGRGVIHFVDFDRLSRAADFDPTFLEAFSVTKSRLS